MCTSSVSNVIYHKFSHGAAFYTLNGINVNVMFRIWVVHFCFTVMDNYCSKIMRPKTLMYELLYWFNGLIIN